MATYEELRQRSMNFSKRLYAAQLQPSNFGFFSALVPTAIPFLDLELLRLIELTAILLPAYQGASVRDDNRANVLIGMYCYVEAHYRSLYTSALYTPLFTQINLEIGEIDENQKIVAIVQLQCFCIWVAENRSEPQVKKLWDAMPLEMQVDLEKILSEDNNHTSSFWATVRQVGSKASEGCKNIFQ